jgi:hypothetical protein
VQVGFPRFGLVAQASGQLGEDEIRKLLSKAQEPPRNGKPFCEAFAVTGSKIPSIEQAKALLFYEKPFNEREQDSDKVCKETWLRSTTAVTN